MTDFDIRGGKAGGDKPHVPVETPNNLLSVAYAKVLLAIAEGELAERPTDRNIFLNGTPLANPDGTRNFGGVKWDWRPGTQDQTYIPGLPEVSSEYNVGIELKYGFPWVRQVTKTQLDAIRVTFQWPALLKQELNGDTVGTAINYAIDIAVDGGDFVTYEEYRIKGKTNTAYERTHRVDLPKASSGWIIRARRLTVDSQSGAVQDTMNVKSIAEVVDVKQRYPNTALLYVEFDSRMFGGGAIPQISVETKGRVIRVPENYDPETRDYTGIWNGAFKWAWSDNPAWVFHDIITQDRFGLGNKVDLNMVDKWALYEIAQYCDVLVDKGDGSGDKEPRHTCNIFIQEKQDAWQVLRDIASIFNGMTYWNGNQFIAVADKEENISNIPAFSRVNVMNGRFDYAAADDKSIYTSALVSYDEPDNHYGTEVEATFETSQIIRWGGDRQIELSAIGCTSRGEAQRKGKYTLITNMFNRTVSFRTGLQGMNSDVMPGKLIHVLDPLIGGRPFTGRVRVATGTVLTLDRDVQAKSGDIMYVTRTNGLTEARTILQATGNIVTLQTPYTEVPLPNAVWYLESSDLKSQLFRVTKITSPEENVFEIDAVEYNESKYAAVDNGARLETRPVSVVPPNIQQAPSNIQILSNTYVEQTMAITTMTLSWDQTPNAVQYEAEWSVGDGDWVNLGTTGALEFNVRGIYTGQYLARVRAINAYGIKSVWATSMATQLNGKDGKPPVVAAFQTTPMFFGIRLDWFFPEGAEDTLRTEIMYGESPSFIAANKLGDYAYPTDYTELHGLAAGKRFYFWTRLVDRTGNVGPWYPNENQAGVIGQSQINDRGQYNEYFAGLISDTALDKTLHDRIDLIDGDGPGSVNERLEDAVENLEEQIRNATDALVYDPNKTYVKGDVVRQGQNLYQATGDVPENTTPPNELYWKDIGDILQQNDGLAAQVELNTVAIEVLDGKVTATASSIESLQAAYRDDDGEGDLNDALAGWDTRAQIVQERVVRADADTAIARELVIYKAQIEDSQAAITSLNEVVVNANEATGRRIDALEVQIDEDVTAAIRQESEARVTADEAIANRVDTIEAGLITDVQVNALIQIESDARTTADEAIARQVTSVQASVGEQSVAIQEVTEAQVTADGKITSSWTLKMEQNDQGQYVAAGIGLGIENGPAGLQSQFLVRADRFAVVNGTTTTTLAPFVIENGQVFISKALIGEGYITNAMIGDVIQSHNFENNKTGWQINKNGAIQINGTNGQGRLSITNNIIQVFDVNGTLRVRMGLWD